MEPIILTHYQNRVGYITLNRPEKRNALSPELIAALSEAFSEMENNPDVKVVLLQAKGRAFCAGADL
ncbi:MAG: methylglutaconyl-CoA hydratase, partial [Algoriphagus sp. 32-45-6]